MGGERSHHYTIPALRSVFSICCFFFFVCFFQLRILWCHSPYATAELFDEMKVSSPCSFSLVLRKVWIFPPFMTPRPAPPTRLSAPGDRTNAFELFSVLVTSSFWRLISVLLYKPAIYSPLPRYIYKNIQQLA